jgi:hypothetical protein
MRREVRKVGGVAHSLAWLTRLSNTLGTVIMLWYTYTILHELGTVLNHAVAQHISTVG